MSQTMYVLRGGVMKPVRPARRVRGYDPGPDCRVCGYKRINVRHNTTPESQIEGPDYYADMLHELHDFQPPDPA